VEETPKARTRLKLPIRSFLVCPVTVKFEVFRLFWPYIIARRYTYRQFGGK